MRLHSKIRDFFSLVTVTNTEKAHVESLVTENATQSVKVYVTSYCYSVRDITYGTYINDGWMKKCTSPIQMEYWTIVAAFLGQTLKKQQRILSGWWSDSENTVRPQEINSRELLWFWSWRFVLLWGSQEVDWWHISTCASIFSVLLFGPLLQWSALPLTASEGATMKEGGF